MLTKNKDKYLIFKIIGGVLCLVVVSRCSYVAGQNSIHRDSANSTVQQKTVPLKSNQAAKELKNSNSEPPKPIIQSVNLNEETMVPSPPKPLQPPKSNWEWQYDVDEMTSNVRSFAHNYSTNKLSFDFPYQGDQQGSLLVRHQSSEGSDVIISIQKGQIQCRSYSGCKIKVRFDQNPPEEFDAAGPADNSSEMVFILDTKTFLEKLEKSEKLLVQLTVFHEGNPVLEFDTNGFSSEQLMNKK